MEGKCKKCQSEDLKYHSMELLDLANEVYYPFTCEKCGVDGREYYSLTYIETIMEGEE